MIVNELVDESEASKHFSRSFHPMHSAGIPSRSKRCLPRASTGISYQEDGHSVAIV
ncbi:unnamed protein product [Spirodela intermedia]|uniref:Uncharacterized protein n=1 Tax=Spirodela intermedia TaxID=51605 RepID=A0A7I8L9V1_SPIIN|nr:unnamed protein product [Spirodela intermedia]